MCHMERPGHRCCQLEAGSALNLSTANETRSVSRLAQASLLGELQATHLHWETIL